MRTYKKLTLTFLSMLTIVAATAFAYHNQPQQDSNLSTKEEATQIKEGVLSEKQKAHSKLYKKYTLGRGNLFEDVKKRGDIKIVVKDESNPSSVENITCAADAIVIGVIQNKASQVTEEKNFIFTDYDVIVEDVLKASSGSSTNPFTTITISHPGGVVGINGDTVTAIQEAFKSFKVGKKYLLFLQHLPLTNSYQVVSSNGSFLIKGGKVIQLKRKQLSDISEVETEQEIFRLKIDTAINTCNVGKGRVSQ